MADVSPVVRVSSLLIRLSGVILLVVVAVGYGWAIHGDRMPPGHPWSGITLTLFGIRAVVWPIPGIWGASPGTHVASVVLTVLPLISGGLWAASAFLQP